MMQGPVTENSARREALLKLSQAMMALIMSGDSGGAEKMAAGAGNMENALAGAAMGSGACPGCDDAMENEMEDDESEDEGSMPPMKGDGKPKAVSIELWKTDLFKPGAKRDAGGPPVSAAMLEKAMETNKAPKGRGRRG